MTDEEFAVLEMIRTRKVFVVSRWGKAIGSLIAKGWLKESRLSDFTIIVPSESGLKVLKAEIDRRRAQLVCVAFIGTI